MHCTLMALCYCWPLAQHDNVKLTQLVKQEACSGSLHVDALCPFVLILMQPDAHTVTHAFVLARMQPDAH